MMTEKHAEFAAYAKINLFLDVTGKREDGYHLLSTVMHRVSLCDTVKLTLNCSGIITVSCSDSSIPSDGGNICFKAAESFYSAAGISSEGVSIYIDKRIPSQAGMGGGSADAAAVILGLNFLHGNPLTEEQLLELGVKIGADVPFCIKGGCALCTGIGEIMEPLPTIDFGYIVIGKGKDGISTKEAFAAIDSLDRSAETWGTPEFFREKHSDFNGFAENCRNIFDEVTQLSQVALIKNILLENGAACACMTGSGSAVFGLFGKKTDADKAECALKKDMLTAMQCRFL
ncbi:MAG: 4-(cytidine 5'-diphospho)-2-C-methyl-D-erythritol kinase [Huintestinicola sp.]